MPSVRKPPSTLASTAAPLAITLTSSALEMLTTGSPGLATWLAGHLPKLPGIAADALKKRRDSSQQAASFLTGDTLSSFTGTVLEALTREFAASDPAEKDRPSLLALAEALPAWWSRLCRDGDPATHPLTGPPFAQTLADSLTHPGTRPPLSEAALKKLLTDAAKLLQPPPPADTIKYLAAYLHQRFQQALAHGLTSLHGDSDRAFRVTILHLHAQSIAAIQDHTDQFNDFLNAHIKATDGLNDALQTIHASIRSVKKDTRATRRDVSVIKKGVQKMEAALTTKEADARLTDYLTALVAGFRGYNEIGIDDYVRGEDEAPLIWKIFVPPACTTDRALSPEEMDEAQTAEPPSQPAVELLPLLADEKTRRHVLLADPGMGKSTLIQRLTAGIASGQSTPGARALDDCIPIPIILRDIVPHLPEDGSEWNWSTLCDTMRVHYKRDDNAPAIYSPWPDLRSLRTELLSSPRAFFLVDGLDEIGDAIKRTVIRDAIWEGFRTYPNARWLVTSRIVGYEIAKVHADTFYTKVISSLFAEREEEEEEELERAVSERWGPLANFCHVFERSTNNDGTVSHGVRSSPARVIYLAPFDNARQDAFVTNWFRERKTNDHPPGLMGEVRSRKHDGIRVLSRVPNLLSYMAILKRDGKPLPDGRAELYLAIARAYLHGIDNAYRLSEKHGQTCPIPFDGRMRLLAILAGEMQHRRATAAAAREAEEAAARGQPTAEPEKQDGNIVIAEADLRTLLLPALARLLPGRDPEKELTDFLRFIASRSGLLLPRGSGPDGRPLYGFTHLSFLEFFAACYLREELAHQKDMRNAAALAREEERPFDEAAYLKEYPRGPLVIRSADLPGFAARAEWHEVLIFLAEFFYDKPRERDPVLYQFFPALHSTDPIPVCKLNDLRYQPLLPLAAASIAIKLARDQHLNLPDPTRHAWFVRLWDGYFAWRWHAGIDHPWAVDRLLLDRVVHEAEVLAAFREAALRHSDITELNIRYCPGFTEVSIIRQFWPSLRQLSLTGCSNLRTADGLPASLTYLSLIECTGVIAVDHLPAALSNLKLNDCTELQAVDHLPTSLTHLELARCTGLSAVDHLPASVKELHLTGSTGLSAMDHLPASMKSLFLNGCTGLGAEALRRVNKTLLRCRIYGP